MNRVIVMPEAERDLRDIGRYIARDNPARAVSYIRELRQKINKIGELPAGYPVRDDLRVDLRSAVHQSYLIFFRITSEQAIEITRVLHGARDFDEIFS